MTDKERLALLQSQLTEARQTIVDLDEKLTKAREENPGVFQLLDSREQAGKLVRKLESEGRSLGIVVLDTFGEDALPSLFYSNPRKEWRYDTGKMLTWIVQSELFGVVKIDDKKLGKTLSTLDEEKLVDLEAEQVETPYVSIKKE
jgi:hypothetical protein